MNSGDGEQASHDELLKAQAHIWNHIFNFINSMSLKCAIELGIPDIIQNHAKPITVSELVAALPIHPTKTHHVFRLMRILVFSGFFDKKNLNENEEKEEEGYALNHSSRLLLKNNPLSVRPFLLSMLDPILMNPWHYVSTWFQNEDVTPFQTANGRTLWDYCEHDMPNVGHVFNEAMASDARLVSSVVIDKCKWVFEGLKSLVDVGGGTGTMAKAIATAFPHVDCTVLDLPHVVADLQGCENLKFIGGDMFEAVPPADAILFKWILHDWNHEECIKILRNCKEAIISNGGGKLIIIDMVVDDQNENAKSVETQLIFDVLMMILVKGIEKSEKEWVKLFFDAGFSDYKITPILGLRSLIEVYP